MSEIRWIQRFNNYKKAFSNLMETKRCIDENEINNIYTMALIQAYEIAFELAWKTLKDYLEYNGIKADTPREVIKEAFSNNIIENGQIWIEMMEARNKTSHTYKEELAKSLTTDILNCYINEFERLLVFLNNKTEN